MAEVDTIYTSPHGPDLPLPGLVLPLPTSACRSYCWPVMLELCPFILLMLWPSASTPYSLGAMNVLFGMSVTEAVV